jgi:hypothetical protein
VISPEESARLHDVITACDAVLAEHADSPDPVALRRVEDALYDKGQALKDLGEFEQSLVTWERLLALLEEPDHADAPPFLTAGALNGKRVALQELERLTEAGAVDQEVIRRFAAGTDPDSRHGVAFALRHRAWVLLQRGGDLDEALALTDELQKRFEREPDDAISVLATIVTDNARELVGIGGTQGEELALVAATMTVGVAIEASRRVLGLVSRYLPAQIVRLVANDRVKRSLRQLLPAPVRDARRRLQRGTVVCATVIDRLKDSDDPELQEIVATARICSASAGSLLGHPLGSGDTFEELIEEASPGTVRAFNALAEQQTKATGRLAPIGAIAFLAQRAEALGGADWSIARIAYDDSVAAIRSRLPESRLLNWLIDFLRPSGDDDSEPESSDDRPSWLP